MRGRLLIALALLGIAGAAVWAAELQGGSPACGAPLPGSSVPADSTTRAAYPLRMSPNRRYLVDRRGRPFLMVGDSPQALIGDLCMQDAGGFISDRARVGFNTLWVNLLCAKYTGCNADGSTRDGVPPFRTEGDLTTPNAAYFDRAAKVIEAARRAGILILLDPIETGGWLDVLRKNGQAAAKAYGRFLGRRFRAYPNIVWFNGNDFQTWHDTSDDVLVHAVAEGIRSVDRTHIQTLELDFSRSGSLDDSRWRDVIALDAAYTYYATYAQVLREYNRESHLPVFMVEASYEFEQNGPTVSKGTPATLRRQEYWSALSGASGQLYGNHYTWQFIDGWRDHLDTVGVRELGYLTKLLRSLPWYELVPDQRHRIVTAGYGQFAPDSKVADGDYVTTAATPDRAVSLSYLPAGGTVVLDLTHARPPVRARWFDPTSGTFRKAISGSKSPRRATYAAPARNHAGDPDWVLVID
jgi:hypothetical protein